MKSILSITPFYSPNLGGVETHLDDLAVFLKKEGIKQTVVTYQPLTTCNLKPPIFQKEKNFSVYRLPWIKFNLFYRFEPKPLLQFPYLFTGIFLFSFFYLLVNQNKFDIIHGHGLAATVGAFILAKMFGKKLVVSLHTIYKFDDRKRLAWIMKRFFLKADTILVLARGAKDDLISIGIPSEKILVYTNWLDLKSKFFPQDQEKCKKELNLDSGKFIALFVGRLSPEKGVKLLLATIPKVSKEIQFVIVGGGPMKSEVEAVAKKYKNVKYIGPIANDKLPLFYNAADVLFWGSVDQDYFGRVTMGALGCGLPVLIPSKTEYFGKLRPVEVDFPQGKIGYMLDADPKQAAKKLIELAKSKNLPLMRKACREYSLKHFSVKNAKVFLRVYGVL